MMLRFVVVAFVARSVVMVEDAEFKFWRVDEDSAMSEVRVEAPALSVLAPMLMAPNEPPIAPAVSVPTEVREDARTEEPSAVAVRTPTLFTVYAPPVARFTLPPRRVMPFPNVLVLPPVTVNCPPTFAFVVVAFVAKSVVMVLDAELKFWRVEEPEA